MNEVISVLTLSAVLLVSFLGSVEKSPCFRGVPGTCVVGCGIPEPSEDAYIVGTSAEGVYIVGIYLYSHIDWSRSRAIVKTGYGDWNRSGLYYCNVPPNLRKK